MVILFVIFYFLIIRPQQLRTKQQARLLSTLKAGDRVVTSSGIVGVVITIKEKSVPPAVSIRSADAKFEITKESITQILADTATESYTAMKHNNLGWFICVICLVLWALVEIYPPTSRDLVQEFANRAQNRDANLTNIIAEATALQKAGTNSGFGVLQQAIGTNDIQKYFPRISATNQVRPNLYILNQLQRSASGKIKLGLDLQGGTSYLMEMDTTKLSGPEGTNKVGQMEISGALSQAIDVLRKRVDKFGVAEPVIQAAGASQILVQMPGLSPADKAQAETNLTKSAFLEFRLVNDKSSDMVEYNTGRQLSR